MKKTLYLATLIAVIAVAYLAGLWSAGRLTTTSAAGMRTILYYQCPMHPAYTSDKPGIAPCCGMALEAVYADGEKAGGASSSLPPGALRVSTEKQQLIGVRTVAVTKTAGASTVRIFGRVAADDARVYPIKAAVDGWIREVYPSSVGKPVKKGQPLASFYAPEFLRAEQDFVFTLNSLSRVKPPVQDSPSQFQLPDTRLQLALDALRNLGMDDQQIEELKDTRKFTEDVVIHAPETGFVMSRDVAPGLRFQKGAVLYRVADLRRVWILAELFENEASLLRAGLTAKVSYPQLGKAFNARVSEVLPEFDPATRTLKVRLETDNPGYALRPDMFVDVEFQVNRPPMLTVPPDAVVDTGLRKTLFVDLGGGRFEPRQVITGERFGDQLEIVKGLNEGERVVVSANFLLDSESRMQAAAMGLHDNAVDDPACGMKVDPVKAGDRSSVYEGMTYFFCSAQCKTKFDADPAKYVKAGGRIQNSEIRIQNSGMGHSKGMDSPVRTGMQGKSAVTDVVCGMDVDASASGVAKSDYKGTTYYFCNPSCKERFDLEPEKYLKKRPEGTT
jgi:Cu(I)/Ag(I) efflux system membrane fusion protein